MAMKVTVSEIFSNFQSTGAITEVLGDQNTVVTRISAIEDGGPGDLVFVDKKDYLSTVQTNKPSVVVTSSGLKGLFSEIKGLTVLVSPHVPLAHALIKQKYSSRDFGLSGWGKGVHASAVVHDTAVIDSSVVIEPKVVVGARAKIGKNTRIMAGSVIEHDAVIGENVIVHPNVVIGYGCQVGNQAVIASGSVIGSEGYGFAQDAKRKSYPIPQTGIVVIEDRVRVGANNCIDRAAYKVTRIGAGTKLDNLCHVAHNVDIGEDCLLTSMLCVAGSTKIGNRVITSGQTGILDHMTVCDDVVLVHRAGVSKDIDKPGVYAGTPTMPLSDYMKNTAVLRDAVELRKRISHLEKELLPKQET